MNLIELSEETIVHILARTPPLGILTCREVCRTLCQLIDTSAELQYLLELHSFGYIPPNNPRLDLSYTEKVSLLREHQQRWKSTRFTKVDTYPLRRTATGYSSAYDFYGGIYVRGSSMFIGGHTRRLDFYQLPSVNKGVGWKQWSHLDLGVDVCDLTIEPDYDLLVLLEMNDHVPKTSTSEGAHDAMQHFTIHLRSLETNQPHPDAERPAIGYYCPLGTTSRFSFQFQVVGRYLAIVFLTSGVPPARLSSRHLGMWDWTTGRLITFTETTSDGSETFTFISDRLFLIPCPTNGTGNTATRRQGRLDIYTFTEPAANSPAQPARRIASLMLPEIAETMARIAKFTCRSYPAPSPSSQAATRHRGHPRLFQLAPDNRVLCLTIRVVVVNSEGEVWARREGMLNVPFTDVLSTVAHLLDEPNADRAVEVAWEDWAKRTSWTDTSSLHTGNERYVYGQRVVSTGIGFINLNSGGDVRLTRRVPFLVVLDFDPIRVRREILQPDSNIRIFDPASGTLLGILSGAGELRTAFLEGKHRAAAPIAVRKTIINEILTANHYVMIDDEHVVLVLQNTWGSEYSLIVYSFN